MFQIILIFLSHVCTHKVFCQSSFSHYFVEYNLHEMRHKFKDSERQLFIPVICTSLSVDNHVISVRVVLSTFRKYRRVIFNSAWQRIRSVFLIL